MRKYLLVVGWAMGLFFGHSVAHAAGSAMVINVSGDVVVEAFGKAEKVRPFSRLLEGDRVKLVNGSGLTVVYIESGRQEAWSGVGVIAAGDVQSSILSGSPVVQARQLPRQVVQQLTRTPQADSTGKAGMVRMRSLPPLATPESLVALDERYQELRKEAQADDRMPEAYLLAGLYERGAYDHLERELIRLQAAYPGDQSLQSLGRIYAQAIANARQPAQP